MAVEPLPSMYGTIAGRWKLEDGTFHWTITVPANMTATVYPPTRSAHTVTEGEKPAGEAKGVSFLCTEADAAVFRVGSGTYVFRCEVADR